MHVRKSSLLFDLNRTFSGVHWNKGGGGCEREILSRVLQERGIRSGSGSDPGAPDMHEGLS